MSAKNYNTATIAAHWANLSALLSLDTVSDENSMVDELFAHFSTQLPEDEAEQMDRDTFAGELTFTAPEGFAVHLFKKATNGTDLAPCANFDDLLEVWSDETDDDRREAMGEYLDDTGADDLSDFEEAYQGQFQDGGEFAQHIAEELGEVPKELPSWIVIDWDASWDRGLRFDYTITDSGHVFRNL